MGADETLSTVQVDFAQPRRLGLRYVTASGAHATPYCIHRAPLSTHERFVAYLTERYGGAFPTWLAPVQVLVVAVSDRFEAYANEVVARLRGQFVRARLAPLAETVSRNIRDAVAQRVPNVVVLGQREQRDGRVTVRRLGIEQQLELDLAEFQRLLLAAIRSRARQVG